MHVSNATKKNPAADINVAKIATRGMIANIKAYAALKNVAKKILVVKLLVKKDASTVKLVVRNN
jgi:hypothetical protein